MSALRLAEKGYRVTVLERGEHFRSKAEMPTSSWDMRKYNYAPRFGLRGLFKMTLFNGRLRDERRGRSAAAASSTR